MEKKNNSGLYIFLVILILIVIGLGGYIVYDKVLNKNDINNSNDDLVEEVLSQKEATTITNDLVKKAIEIYEGNILFPYCGETDDNDILEFKIDGNDSRYVASMFNSLVDLKSYLANYLSSNLANEIVTEDVSDINNLEYYSNYIEKEGKLYCRRHTGKGYLTYYTGNYNIENLEIEKDKISGNIIYEHLKDYDSNSKNACIEEFDAYNGGKKEKFDSAKCESSQLKEEKQKVVITKNNDNNWVLEEFTLHE